MLCSQHHRLVHEGGYSIELDDPGSGPDAVDPRRRRSRRRVRRANGPSVTLRFRRPDGTVVANHFDPGPLRGPTVAERARRSGAEIDPSTCQARSAGARCDHGIAINGLLERVAAVGREHQAGMPAVSSSVSAASSGPSERRSASGGDSAKIDSRVCASDEDTGWPVWAND